jgi:acyl transferase domain-containing protein/acyl carrier protein
MRRSQYEYRLAAIGSSREELMSGLQAFQEGELDPGLILGSEVQDRQPKLVFVFSGQGGQWFGMCRELLKREPVFYKAIERIDQLIQLHFKWSLLEELNAGTTDSRINEIGVIQPALFAIQIALSELWQSWGILPDAVVGHSMGEVAAAHIAGILSLEDAVKIIGHRSKLMMPLQGRGSMLVTELSPDQARELLEHADRSIALAVINSPTSTVLSGDSEAVKKIMESLERKDIFCRLVQVDVASHSPQMDQLRPELLELLQGINPLSPKIPIYSTVTGARGDDLNFNADYWIDNLRKTTLFSDAIGNLLENEYSTFVEIGPHPNLLGSIQQSLQAHHQGVVRLLPSLRREEPEREVMLGTLGALYTEGYPIDWKQLHPARGRFVKLPSIPWQGQRYWIEAVSAGAKGSRQLGPMTDKVSHPLLGDSLNLASTPSSYVWQKPYNSEVLRILEDHRLENEIVFPAAAYMEMALQAAEESGLSKSHELSDFEFKESMILQAETPGLIQAHLSPLEEGNFSFSVYSRGNTDENWKLHASARLNRHQGINGPSAGMITSPDEIRQRSTLQRSTKEFYESMQLRGVEYGPDFRNIEQLWSNENESLGRIRFPESLQYDVDSYQIHPAILDACLQVVAGTLGATLEHDLFLPAGCKSIRFFAQPDHIMWSHATLISDHDQETDIIEADISLLDNQGQILAQLTGFKLQRTSRRVRRLLSQQDTSLYKLQWQTREKSGIIPTALPEGKTWLIFADDEDIGEALAEQLEQNGNSCQLLLLREVVKEIRNGSDGALFAIIDKLLKEISSPLVGVIHLWSLSIPPQSSDSLKTSEALGSFGCNSVLYLVQALAKRISGMPRLWLVTRGAQAVRDDEAIAVEQSPVWGLGKVISFELPELKCIRIDLDPHQTTDESVQILLRQLSIDDREDQIAYRGGIRAVLRILPFIPSKPPNSSSASLRADGTYLITGGLGGLGLETAKWMALRGAKHLVLMGRSEPSPSARLIVEQLQKDGMEVLVSQADVSNQADMEKVFGMIKRSMPELRGIVHAAGVLDDGSMLNLNEERMKKVLAPKVDGTWNLHRESSQLPLDFFVLFSSAVSVLGSPGQGNYAAASAYLDAMAYLRHHQGVPAISINWGPWAEVGLAAESTERLEGQNASTQHLIKVIHINQGLEILEQLLTESTTQVMVLPFDLKNLIELYPTAAGMPFLEEVGGSDSHIAHLYARPKLRQQYLAPRNEIERKMVELWSQTLHIDRVGVKDSFFELGGDSVLAAQILSLAQKTFGIRINPQDAFKAFTIERLAEMLETEIRRQIEDMSEEEAQRRLSNKN